MADIRAQEATQANGTKRNYEGKYGLHAGHLGEFFFLAGQAQRDRREMISREIFQLQIWHLVCSLLSLLLLTSSVSFESHQCGPVLFSISVGFSLNELICQDHSNIIVLSQCLWHPLQSHCRRLPPRPQNRRLRHPTDQHPRRIGPLRDRIWHDPWKASSWNCRTNRTKSRSWGHCLKWAATSDSNKQNPRSYSQPKMQRTTVCTKNRTVRNQGRHQAPGPCKTPARRYVINRPFCEPVV